MKVLQCPSEVIGPTHDQKGGIVSFSIRGVRTRYSSELDQHGTQYEQGITAPCRFITT